MKPNEFITFAGQIVGMKSAGARSAISRAYYGTYHLASQVLEDLGFKIKSRSLHGKLDLILDGCGNDHGRLAGSLIGDLYNGRVKADYRLDNPEVEQMAFAMVLVETAYEAQSELALLRTACDDAANRKQIADALRAKCTALQLSIE
jgi:hypothetical protein